MHVVSREWICYWLYVRFILNGFPLRHMYVHYLSCFGFKLHLFWHFGSGSFPRLGSLEDLLLVVWASVCNQKDRPHFLPTSLPRLMEGLSLSCPKIIARNLAPINRGLRSGCKLVIKNSRSIKADPQKFD